MNEAKHKEKLIPEIDKVEAEFQAVSKSNVNGRVIDYGNGVSIDTDDVIYIEKGPDFHSYTFHIIRENAPLDAPVENLLLSPLQDGSYQELLITYHLTEQEKQKLTQGGFVDTSGKVTVSDLQKGTFNSGGQLAKTTDCTWTIKSYYTTCSQGVHSHGEPAGSGEPGTDTCAAPTLSQLVVMVDRTCTALPASTGLGENGEGGGSGPQNGPGGLGGNNPEETVTAPNLPIPTRGDLPCEKIKNSMNKAKEINNNTIIKSQNDIMKAGITTDINEKGFSFGFDANGDYKTSPIVEMGTAGGNIPLSNLDFTPVGTYHNHNGLNIPPCPSPTDIYGLNTVRKSIPTFDYYFVNGSDNSQFVLSIIDPVTLNKFVQDYPMDTNVDVFHAQNNPNGNNFWKKDSKIYKEFMKVGKYFLNQGESNFNAQAYGMAFVMQKYKMGITVGKKDNNGNFRPLQVSTKIDKDDPSKLTYELQYPCGL